jgi:DNA repair photolyase
MHHGGALVDVRDHLLSLLGDVAIGGEIQPGVRLVGASTELGLRLTFATADAEVHVEVSPVEDAVKYAARTDRLLFAYRSGGAEHVAPALGKALCEEVARIARTTEADVLDALASDAARATQAEQGTARVREVSVDRLLEAAGTPAERFYTLSPYVGCLIGCRFCYAQERLAGVRRLAGLPDVRWGSWVDVRVNAPEVLAAELASSPGHPVKFCPIVSDPYQAIDVRYGLTRRCLEVIRDADAPPPTMILSRSTLIRRDADVLAAIPQAWAAMSIPTIDDDVRAHFEPRGAPIDERLEALRDLRDAGVRCCAVVQPMLPGSVDELAVALAGAVESVSIDVLRGEYGAERLFDVAGYRASRDPAWQDHHALALRDALTSRGVAVWHGELPPQLSDG